MDIPPIVRNNGNSYCFEPNSGYFVLPNNNGMLQVYDLTNDRTIIHLQVIFK